MATIPKMICGILATISIVVIGFLSLSAFWFWTCLEIIAGLLVAGGCWGEWYLFKNPADEGDESAKHLHHSRELRCIIAVAIGVTVEFAALAHSIPEAMQLEKDVAEIGTTNALLVADNLILRSSVVTLELKSKRKISSEQTNAFINLLRNQCKTPVRICVQGTDAETKNFSRQLREMLDASGYAVTNGGGITTLNGDYYSPIGEPAADLPFGFVFYGRTGENLDWGDFSITFTNDGTIYHGYYNRISSVPAILDFAFRQIGMKPAAVAWTNFPTVTKPGDWVIFIPEKF